MRVLRSDRCPMCKGPRDVVGYATCTRCRGRAKKNYRDQKPRVLRLARKRRLDRNKLGRCHRCNRRLNGSSRAECRACQKHSKLQRDALKLQVFKAYGGARCRCCGETTLLFLSIDHKHNNGAKHRRQGVGSGVNLYRWLRRNGYPRGFQVLCHNCNLGRHLNGGTCPHKQVRHA